MSIDALRVISLRYSAPGEFAPPGQRQPLPLRGLSDAAGATTGRMSRGGGELAAQVWRGNGTYLPQAAHGRERTAIPVPTQASAPCQGPACPRLRADGEPTALS